MQIANPAPLLSINAVPADTTATTAALRLHAHRIDVDADANVTSVQCALDIGAFETVGNVAGNWSRWRKDYSLGAGLHRFTVRAIDLGGNQAQQQALPDGPSAGRRRPDPGTASITSWTRLEPHCRDADMGRSISARLFDPLWMMTRQWQIGEFQGEDAGTPVQARVRATSAMLSRCHLGELPANTRTRRRRATTRGACRWRPWSSAGRMRPASANDARMLTLAVEAGLHFLRMLELQPPCKSYRAAFIAKFALQPLPRAVATAADDATRRFMQTMAGRAPDARLLAAAFRPAGGIAQVVHDADAGDRRRRPSQGADRRDRLARLVRRRCSPNRRPADDAWMPSRLEYAVTVSARFSDQPLRPDESAAASEFDGGRLDWSSFDGDFEVELGQQRRSHLHRPSPRPRSRRR